MALSTKEARLISISRAIDQVDRGQLVNVEDVGIVLSQLEMILDLEKEEGERSGNDLKALIFGFVAGLASVRLAEALSQAEQYAPGNYIPYEDRPEFPSNALMDEEQETQYVGGPTGGTVVGQGTDPNLVTQSGVSSQPEDKVK